MEKLDLIVIIIKNKTMSENRDLDQNEETSKEQAKKPISHFKKIYMGEIYKKSSWPHYIKNEILSTYDDSLPQTIRLIIKSNFDKQLSLEQEITDLKVKLHQTINDLSEATSDKEKKIEELNKLKEELQSKEKINHILPRICEEAKQKLLTEEIFRQRFADSKSCESVVISIDIRRSTELMLKARTPELFSKFITELSQKLSEVIISNLGVFDKFTGDGILAFFPKFYSGELAILRAIKAAGECHKIFEEHYKNSRVCFNVFIKDVGLGIGVDYGTVSLVNTRNELTVVGIPVVYACRMSGAKAGETLLNQPAKEEVEQFNQSFFKITESEINIKNEGNALAYKIEILKDDIDLKKPDWMNSEEN